MKKAIWFIFVVVVLIGSLQVAVRAFDEAYLAGDCVPNAETAGKLAIVICEAVYPEEDLYQYNRQIGYSEEKAIWRIYFSNNAPNVTGGGIYVEIRKNNAEVISLIRTK